MSASVWDVLGAIGAITGVPALGWQVFTWRKSQAKLVVKAANAFPTYGDRLGDHHFSISVINEGGTATEVTGWGLRLPDGSSLIDFNPLPFSDKPGRIEPHGRLTFFVEGAGSFSAVKNVASLRLTCVPMSPQRPLATFTASRSLGRIDARSLCHPRPGPKLGQVMK
jgi:hypothetical protein